MAALASTAPDKLAIWPVDEGGFGIDVRWSGKEASRHAAVVRGLLEQADVRSELEQTRDGRGWELHVGPVPGTEVPRVIDEFVC